MAMYWAITLLSLAIASAMVAWYAPVETTMGLMQKIFYLHLPAAMCMFAACFGVFIGGVGYIWQRSERWSELAFACAEVAVVLSAIVLVTGMIWGHHAWGHWWTWSPRLTFSLILWLLYVAYVVLYKTLPRGNKRAMMCALYGVIAFIDVPLVYLSVKLLPDIHPSDVQLAPAMRQTVLVCMIPVALIGLGVIAARLQRTPATGEAMPSRGVRAA